MIVVVATTADELCAATERLYELGVAPVEVGAPSDVRRLLLASVGDELEGERLVATLRADGLPAVVRPDTGAQLDAWSRRTRPISIGQRLTVCFAWSEHDRRGHSNVVELDSGGGFGTGEHPSTRLLLEELASRIVGGERVLDVGCGSGILGLCALRLGASSVIGIDIDASAVEATLRNAALNGFERRVKASHAPLDVIGETFDVVVANIGRAALVELAPDLVTHVARSGWLGIGGIPPTQCSLAAALLHPLEVREQAIRDEWTSLVLTHT